MPRRRFHPKSALASVSAAVLAATLIVGPVATPAASWSEEVNPDPSPTIGYSDVSTEVSRWQLIGGPLKISLFIPPIDSPKDRPPTGAIGQHVTIETVLETRTPRKVISTVTSSTREVRLLPTRTLVNGVPQFTGRTSATVSPGAYPIPTLVNTHRIKYVVTWRWLTSKQGKPEPGIVRSVTVIPTERADATCRVAGFGTCTVEERGWIRLGLQGTR